MPTCPKCSHQWTPERKGKAAKGGKGPWRCLPAYIQLTPFAHTEPKPLGSIPDGPAPSREEMEVRLRRTLSAPTKALCPLDAQHHSGRQIFSPAYDDLGIVLGLIKEHAKIIDINEEGEEVYT